MQPVIEGGTLLPSMLHPITHITRGAIREQARIVAQARGDAAEAKDALSILRAAWEEHQSVIISRAKELSELQVIAEAQLRDLALMYHADTGDKHPGSGVEIRILQRLSYNPDIALLWAKEHRLAISLDKRAFESIAKNDPIDFVEISEEASATIATDLAKALEKEEQHGNQNG